MLNYENYLKRFPITLILYNSTASAGARCTTEKKTKREINRERERILRK
jgi:hypothetical protein